MTHTQERRCRKSWRPLVSTAHPLSAAVNIVWLLTALLLWWIISYFRLVTPLILPPPVRVIQAARDIGVDNLLLDVITTFVRTISGFVLGTLAGLFVGTMVQLSNAWRILWEPFLNASRPVPALALLPFFILLFGFSETGRVILITVSVTVFMAIATIEAIAKVPEQWVRFALVSGLPKSKIYRRVLLPGSLPWLLGPARLCLALAFTLTIAAEFMGSQSGLGYLINIARVNLATPTIWLSILILGAVCQIADLFLLSFHARLTSWYKSSTSL